MSSLSPFEREREKRGMRENVDSKFTCCHLQGRRTSHFKCFKLLIVEISLFFFFKKRNTKFYLHICTYLPDNCNLTRQLFLNSQVFFFFSVFPLKFFSLFLDFCLWLSNVMDVAGRVGARCPAVAPWTQDITHTTPWLVLYPFLIPDYKERQPGPKHTPTLTQKSSHIERETMVGDSRSCLRARATFT